MTAEEIINRDAWRETWSRTAWHCHYATRNATDYDDYLESEVLYEGTLDAEGFMAEAMK